MSFIYISPGTNQNAQHKMKKHQYIKLMLHLQGSKVYVSFLALAEKQIYMRVW